MSPRYRIAPSSHRARLGLPPAWPNHVPDAAGVGVLTADVFLSDESTPPSERYGRLVEACAAEVRRFVGPADSPGANPGFDAYACSAHALSTAVVPANRDVVDWILAQTASDSVVAPSPLLRTTTVARLRAAVGAPAPDPLDAAQWALAVDVLTALASGGACGGGPVMAAAPTLTP